MSDKRAKGLRLTRGQLRYAQASYQYPIQCICGVRGRGGVQSTGVGGTKSGAMSVLVHVFRSRALCEMSSARPRRRWACLAEVCLPELLDDPPAGASPQAVVPLLQALMEATANALDRSQRYRV